MLAYVKRLVRLREGCGRFIGEIIKFLKIVEGLAAVVGSKPPGWPVALLFPTSPGMAAGFDGESLDMSKGLEFELVCFTGHMYSRGPGVPGEKIDQSAANKLTGYGNI